MNLSSLFFSVANTLVATVICLLLAVPLGSWLAIVIARSNAIGRSLAAVALSSQLAVPLYVFAGGWAAGVGLQGWLRVDYWLGPTGLAWMQTWFGRMLAVSLIHALASIPWVALIVSLGLSTCDRGEEEMAFMEGGWSGLIRRIWWPRLRVWIWVSCLWCAMGLLTEMVVSNLYMFPTVAELIYLDVSRDTVSPLTYVVAVLLSSFPILALGLWLQRKLPPWRLVSLKPLHFFAYPFPLGRKRKSLSLLLWGTLFILVGLPIWNLTIKAGWTPVNLTSAASDAAIDTNATVVSYTWTLQRFWQTIVESLTLFQSEFFWSGLLAVCSGSLALVSSSLLYWLTSVPSRSPSAVTSDQTALPFRQAIHVCMLLMICIPGPMIAMILSSLMNRSGLLGELYFKSLTAPILAQQFRLLPLSWLLLCGMMATISSKSWELAQVDALSRWQRLKIVVFPQVLKRVVAAWILLMLLSIGELSCSIGVLPPGVTTTSMRLFEILHFGMRHQDSGLCAALILLGWIAAFFVRKLHVGQSTSA